MNLSFLNPGLLEGKGTTWNDSKPVGDHSDPEPTAVLRKELPPVIARCSCQ